MANRLADQSSPYLLQHANNPVDWYPWGADAFERARREDKPLLISIGYSTCHWCHVMERESFEDPAIAAVMNAHVVAVKVDREERPEVDRIYMTAIQALTGQGGWPLNVFVTPEGKPFIGGTYFPPTTRQGRRGWPEVVESIGRAWRDPVARERMVAQGEGLTEAARALLTGGQSVETAESSTPCFQSFKANYDSDAGGFSSAPKFPLPVNQFFLFRYAAHDAGESGRQAREMALHTLRRMAQGGIFDAVGGGFHRYSTDDRWFLPHFEKMLYDNAQLAANYLDAFQLTGEATFARTAEKTLNYLERDLGHDAGGFYSAEDADSLPGATAREKREGAFYVWERAEIESLLGNDAGLFCDRYGVTPEGNVHADPQGEFVGQNVLFEAATLDALAHQRGFPVDEVGRRLDAALGILLAARSRRPRPSRDDKILTAWNGLALSAFARASQVLGNARFLESAQRTAAFLKRNLWDAGVLYRRWRQGRRDIPALADDHAFLAQGLVDLYEADGGIESLLWSEELMDLTLRHFQDPDSGALFSTPANHDPLLLFRAKEEGDNVEPSAASVAALTLYRLSRILDRDDFRQAADRLVTAHLSTGVARAYPAMQAARLFGQCSPQDLVIAGDPADPRTRELLQTARTPFRPHLTLLLLDGARDFFVKRRPDLKGMTPLAGQPAAYLCQNKTCQAPVTSPNQLADLLLA